MKTKFFQWMMAAIFVCGASVFTSCSDDKDSDIENLSEKIIGKWVDSEIEGQPALTSNKSVVTFVSPTKATYSTSKTDFTESQRKWAAHREYDVKITGNKVTMTSHPENNMEITLQEEYIISDITATEMVCKYRHTTFRDGQAQGPVTEKSARLKRTETDYSADIIGTWECKGISGGDTYNDANGRLEFFNDGTYNFYRKTDGGQWEKVTTREFQLYFVDGPLVATRWKDLGEVELRECWEINSLKADKMQWKALRENADGSTFEQFVDWEKVE